MDKLEDSIKKLQDEFVGAPRPAVLESVGEIRSTLMELRRVLGNTQHVAFQLRHVSNPFVSEELSPFLRDVQDNLAIDLEVYLPSVANRTPRLRGSLLVGNCCATYAVVTSLLEEYRLHDLVKVFLDVCFC